MSATEDLLKFNLEAKKAELKRLKLSNQWLVAKYRTQEAEIETLRGILSESTPVEFERMRMRDIAIKILFAAVPEVRLQSDDHTMENIAKHVEVVRPDLDRVARLIRELATDADREIPELEDE